MDFGLFCGRHPEEVVRLTFEFLKKTITRRDKHLVATRLFFDGVHASFSGLPLNSDWTDTSKRKLD